jgi:serine protease AprX
MVKEPRSTPESDDTPPRAAASPLPQADPGRKPFLPDILDKTVIAVPLLEILKAEQAQLEKDPERQPQIHSIIIDLNLEFPKGREAARLAVMEMIEEAFRQFQRGEDEGVSHTKSRLNQQYIFAELRAQVIRYLVARDRQRANEIQRAATGDGGIVRGEIAQAAPGRAIFHIWPDFDVHPQINLSISTVKVDAAHNAFSALGEGIVWAVLDSGIDGDHPHFKKHKNLELGSAADALKHRDFTVPDEKDEKPLEDVFGHGTHVAGIIGGELTEQQGTIEADIRYRNELGLPQDLQIAIRPSISGMAPKCKLVSLKILDSQGRDPEKTTLKGKVSNIMAALDYVQQVNGYGRRIRIHGVNLSVGYDFEPRWFACGQSPLCVEVDRLVKSGVVVVVAAGNTGYPATFTEDKGFVSSGKDLSINDPGNSELAVTVGSTHRDMPHVYGVSYFSSKGPTGDGRRKPDLVAPGEKIISADSTQRRVAKNLNIGPLDKTSTGNDMLHGKYREDTGTSMAAPHVSGVIAAFLSVRREFIGRAEQVKQIFCSTATDLGRERYFQGNGLVDLMRSIQSV